MWQHYLKKRGRVSEREYYNIIWKRVRKRENVTLFKREKWHYLERRKNVTLFRKEREECDNIKREREKMWDYLKIREKNCEEECDNII